LSIVVKIGFVDTLMLDFNTVIRKIDTLMNLYRLNQKISVDLFGHNNLSRSSDALAEVFIEFTLSSKKINFNSL
jgi:hypothetical protein